MTEFSEDKQGAAIALSLLDGEINKIQAKVFNQISLEDWKKADGLDSQLIG